MSVAMKGIYLLVLVTLSLKLRNSVDGIVICSMANVAASNSFEAGKLFSLF